MFVRRLGFALLVLGLGAAVAPSAARADEPPKDPPLPDPTATGGLDLVPANGSGGDDGSLAVGTVQTPPNPNATPARRYGTMDRATCLAELGRRKIPYTAVGTARGVLAPVRLNGALHGVTYHTSLPAAQRSTSPYEILDCRLVLALDDFSAILAKYDVVDVIHFSVYRPPSARAWTEGRIGRQHDGALAIDAGIFVKKDGSQLVVEKDYHGRIGAGTCVAGSGPAPVTPSAITLRSIVCDAAAAHLFNVELTPNYNWAHRNHFHLEVTPTATWFMVH
jgi:hypothetical protein